MSLLLTFDYMYIGFKHMYCALMVIIESLHIKNMLKNKTNQVYLSLKSLYLCNIKEKLFAHCRKCVMFVLSKKKENHLKLEV